MATILIDYEAEFGHKSSVVNLKKTSTKWVTKLPFRFATSMSSPIIMASYANQYEVDCKV